jgi:hypothetical protein
MHHARSPVGHPWWGDPNVGSKLAWLTRVPVPAEVTKNPLQPADDRFKTSLIALLAMRPAQSTTNTIACAYNWIRFIDHSAPVTTQSFNVMNIHRHTSKIFHCISTTCQIHFFSVQATGVQDPENKGKTSSRTLKHGMFSRKQLHYFFNKGLPNIPSIFIV